MNKQRKHKKKNGERNTERETVFYSSITASNFLYVFLVLQVVRI